MAIDLFRGRGFYGFIDDQDAMYKFIHPDNRHVDRATVKPGWHPLVAVGDIEQLKTNFGVVHALLRHLWSHGINDIRALDIGAYIADFTLDLCSFARAAGHPLPATIFEPGATYELVVDNILLNDLADCRAINVAVSDKAGKAKFVMPKGHWNTSHVSLNDRHSEDGETKEVTVLDILDVLAAHGGGEFTIMKIDTEGLDLRILARILSGYAKLDKIAIIFEYTPRLYPIEQRREIFLNLFKHFTVRNIKTHNWTANNPPINPNNLEAFLQNTFAESYGYADMLAIPKVVGFP